MCSGRLAAPAGRQPCRQLAGSAIGITAGAKTLGEQHRRVDVGRALVHGKLGDRDRAGRIPLGQLHACELHPRGCRLRAQLHRFFESCRGLVQVAIRERGQPERVMRGWQIRVALHRFPRLGHRFARGRSIAQQHARLGRAGSGKTRPLGDQLVDDAMGLGLSTGGILNRRDPKTGLACVRLIRRSLELPEQLDCLRIPPDPHVVVGQGEPPRTVDGERAEVRLGLFPPAGRDVQQRERAVGGGALRIDVQSRFERLLGVGERRHGPLVVGECQPGLDRARRELDRLLESRRRVDLAAANEGHRAERRPRWRVRGIDIDRLLDPPHRLDVVVQSRLGVAEQDMGGNVSRIRLERQLRTSRCRLELASEQQDGSGAHVRVHVRRIEVSGAGVFTVCAHQIAAFLIDATQLVTNVGSVGCGRQRPAVLDHRFLELLLRRVGVAARRVIARLVFRARAPGHASCGGGEEHRCSQMHERGADSHGSREER